MDSVVLSVIVPAYNEEEQIGQTLEALLAQSVPIDEIIIVDNNSSDRTADIVREFEHRGPIKLVHESRPGVAHAQRAGMATATGSVLGRIDADTFVTPGWSEAIKRFYALNTGHGATIGLVKNYDGPTMPLMRAFNARIRRSFQGRGWSDYRGVYGQNMSIRREVWDAVADQLHTEPGIWEDCDLSIVLFNNNFKVAFVEGQDAGVSARRMLNSRKDFWAYTAQYPRTVAVNGVATPLVWYTWVLVVLRRIGWMINYLPYRGYNPETHRWNPRFLFARRTSRAAPNAAR